MPRQQNFFEILGLLGRYVAYIGSQLLTANCVTFHNSEDLNHIAVEAWNQAKAPFSISLQFGNGNMVDARLYEMTGVAVTLTCPEVIYDNRLQRNTQHLLGWQFVELKKKEAPVQKNILGIGFAEINNKPIELGKCHLLQNCNTLHTHTHTHTHTQYIYEILCRPATKKGVASTRN